MDHYAGRYPASCTPVPRPEAPRATFSRVIHGVPLVQLFGDIDLATAPEVRLQLDAATTRDRARLIVDLRPADFFDSSAVDELRRARERTVERGGRMALICTDPFGLRVLSVAGLGPALTPVATLEDALESVRG
ncbi:anti-sigma factor antagonist [Streptomyces sp. NPDC088725]|uniref:anti-sigma factor antagonist n=1 Tax=Streptomyces sp. NPDC088725 TaxID=3365873 RepID=UPI0038177619